MKSALHSLKKWFQRKLPQLTKMYLEHLSRREVTFHKTNFYLLLFRNKILVFCYHHGGCRFAFIRPQSSGDLSTSCPIFLTIALDGQKSIFIRKFKDKYKITQKEEKKRHNSNSLACQEHLATD